MNNVGDNSPAASFNSRVADRCGVGSLIVMCALTPVHEGRAMRAVGEAKVREIQRVAKELLAMEPSPQ